MKISPKIVNWKGNCKNVYKWENILTNIESWWFHSVARQFSISPGTARKKRGKMEWVPLTSGLVLVHCGRKYTILAGNDIGISLIVTQIVWLCGQSTCMVTISPRTSTYHLFFDPWITVLPPEIRLGCLLQNGKSLWKFPYTPENGANTMLTPHVTLSQFPKLLMGKDLLFRMFYHLEGSFYYNPPNSLWFSGFLFRQKHLSKIFVSFNTWDF